MTHRATGYSGSTSAPSAPFSGGTASHRAQTEGRVEAEAEAQGPGRRPPDPEPKAARPPWVVPAAAGAGLLAVLIVGAARLPHVQRRRGASAASTTRRASRRSPVRPSPPRPGPGARRRPTGQAKRGASSPTSSSIADDETPEVATDLATAMRMAIGGRGYVVLGNRTPLEGLVGQADRACRGASLVDQGGRRGDAGPGGRGQGRASRSCRPGPRARCEMRGGDDRRPVRRPRRRPRAGDRRRGRRPARPLLVPGRRPRPRRPRGGDGRGDADGVGVLVRELRPGAGRRLLRRVGHDGPPVHVRPHPRRRRRARPARAGRSGCGTCPAALGKTGRQLVLDHCTTRGQGFLDFAGFSPEVPVKVDADGLRRAGRRPGLAGARPTPPTREALSWTGRRRPVRRPRPVVGPARPRQQADARRPRQPRRLVQGARRRDRPDPPSPPVRDRPRVVADHRSPATSPSSPRPHRPPGPTPLSSAPARAPRRSPASGAEPAEPADRPTGTPGRRGRSRAAVDGRGPGGPKDPGRPARFAVCAPAECC